MSQATPEYDIPPVRPEKPIAVVTAQWNGHITSLLRQGAERIFTDWGVEARYYEVPGCIELTYAASRLVRSGRYSAVVVLGCVLRGDTPHFDYVCQSVTQGVTALNVLGQVPVIFGVLTVNDEAQAMARVGGEHGHKGEEAALTAIRMAVM